jgi:hypothetical protein
MLKVVQPPTGGQGEAPSRRRGCRSTALTDVEAMRLRAALRNLRALYGTWARLAEAMGVPHGTLIAFICAKNGASHGLAAKAAKAAETTVERILGAPVAADRCPHCGRGAP